MHEFWVSLLTAVIALALFCPIWYGWYLRAKHSKQNKVGGYVQAAIQLLVGVAVLVMAFVPRFSWSILPVVILMCAFFFSLAWVHFKAARQADHAKTQA